MTLGEYRMETLKSVFLIEVRDQLEALESALLSLERDPGDIAMVHAAFRSAHTIKGSSSMADAMAIATFTHDVENVLERMRNGELSADHELVSALLSCTDHIEILEGFFAADADPAEATAARGRQLLAQLQPWLQVNATQKSTTGQIPAAPPPSTTEDTLVNPHWHIRLRLGSELFQRGVDPLGLVRYLGSLGTSMRVRVLTDRLPDLDVADAELCYLGFVIDLETDVGREDIEDAFSLLQGECVLQILPPRAPRSQLLEQLASAKDNGELPQALVADWVGSGLLDEADARALLAAHAVPVSGPAPQVHETPHTDKRDRPPHNNDPHSNARQTHAQLRVDADKLDKLVDLAGELVIAGAGVSVIASRTGNKELMEAMSVLSRLVEDMRDSAMQMRMVPIGATFNRFQRVVRDLSLELGKDIELLTEGGETELDKSVIEKIGDPLMHLVRNSVDHGIESAHERQAANKPSRGAVTLSAAHEASSIVITIQDDGAGLNTQKILAKAIERNLVDPNQVLSEAEIHQLIFEPGFSTAERVTELSGRGVGMDVVRRNIQALRGTVNVHSVPNQGCTFTIRLPLTLAIIDGFMVGIGDAHFVIPMDMVAECIQHDGVTRSCDYLSLRGELLPFTRLRDLFGTDEPPSNAQENVVVVRYGQKKVGIVVEKLHGEMQAVIKPLGILFQGITGLAGCTLLGTGEIAVILDIPALIEGVARA